MGDGHTPVLLLVRTSGLDRPPWRRSPAGDHPNRFASSPAQHPRHAHASTGAAQLHPPAVRLWPLRSSATPPSSGLALPVEEQRESALLLSSSALHMARPRMAHSGPSPAQHPKHTRDRHGSGNQCPIRPLRSCTARGMPAAGPATATGAQSICSASAPPVAC